MKQQWKEPESGDACAMLGVGGDYIGLVLWAQAWALPHVPLAAREC